MKFITPAQRLDGHQPSTLSHQLAVSAHCLRLEGRTFKEIRRILSLPSPEATRAAVARGQRLNMIARQERELQAAITTLATVLQHRKMTAEQLDAYQPSTLNSQPPLHLEPPPISDYWTKIFIPAYVLFRMSSRPTIAKATRSFFISPPSRGKRETRNMRRKPSLVSPRSAVIEAPAQRLDGSQPSTLNYQLLSPTGQRHCWIRLKPCEAARCLSTINSQLSTRRAVYACAHCGAETMFPRAMERALCLTEPKGILTCLRPG